MSESPELEHLLRAEAPQVLGALVRRFGHFDIAEDAVQDALLAAAQQWPTQGVPDHPRGWLIRVGYRRMIDQLRADQVRQRREYELASRPTPAPVDETATFPFTFDAIITQTITDTDALALPTEKPF